MPDPIILSDDETEAEDPKTPLPSFPKKPRIVPDPNIPTIFVLDDDPTPQKPPAPPASVSPPFLFSASSSIVVPETPLSDISVIKCSVGRSHSEIRVSISSIHPEHLSGGEGLICLESENGESESGSGKKEKLKEDKTSGFCDNGEDENEVFSPSPPRFLFSRDLLGDLKSTHMSKGSSSQSTVLEDHAYQVQDYHDEENLIMQQVDNTENTKGRMTVSLEKETGKDKAIRKKTMTLEERNHLKEEQKLKKEQEKLQKAALKAQEKLEKEAMKAQAAELKKMEKEKKKWETGKFALKSIVAEVDAKVVEQGSVGGHLLTKFSEKSLMYRITSNPIERSIVWRMNFPENILQLAPEGADIRYVLLVFEPEEFCNLVANEFLLDHVSRVRSCYPSYVVCYLTNRLMAYINKREKERYKNLEIDDGWQCPPIEEVLAKLTTHYHRVHYRQCRDEAELAEHVVGLTCSLASCQYRAKLTRLSVNANGSFVPKDCVDRNLIKKNPWLKALVAIPKVQPRFAIAIWKKYPTMKSLLSEYMDPGKSVHEKEFLLQDLTMEGMLGGERRVGQICSKRVYRILMAQSGSIHTDDVEDGADLFRHQPS